MHKTKTVRNGFVHANLAQLCSCLHFFLAEWSGQDHYPANLSSQDHFKDSRIMFCGSGSTNLCFFYYYFFCHSGQLGVRGMILWKIGGPANRSFVKSYPVQCRPHVFEKFLPRSFLKASNDSCLNGSIAANISITCNSVDLCSTCHQESCVKKMMSNLACNLWHQQCHVFDKKNAKL